MRMKKPLPQVHIAGGRQIPATQSAILIAVLLLLILALMCVPVASKDKPQKGSQDPYATAEYETAPVVNAADLAYRTILFEDFTVPAQWEAKARNLVTATEDRAIDRLFSTHAFATIAKKQALLPEDPVWSINSSSLPRKGSFPDRRLMPLPAHSCASSQSCRALKSTTSRAVLCWGFGG